MFNDIHDLKRALDAAGYHAQVVDDCSIRLTKGGAWKRCQHCGGGGLVHDDSTLVVERVMLDPERQTVYCSNGATGSVDAWVKSLGKA